MKLSITRSERTTVARALLAGALALGSSQLAKADPYPGCIDDLGVDHTFLCIFECAQHGGACFCESCFLPYGYWCTGYCS